MFDSADKYSRSFVFQSSQARTETDQKSNLRLPRINREVTLRASFFTTPLTSNQVCFAVMLMQFCFKNVHSFLAALLRWIVMLVSGTQVQQTPVGRTNRLKTRTKDQKGGSSTQLTTPSSVNYHFTRQCNYKCGFCFHTAKTSFVVPIEEAKRGLRLLKEAGRL